MNLRRTAFLMAVLLAQSLFDRAQAEDSTLAKMAEMWKSQQSEVATAYIKARLINTGGVLPIDRAKVNLVLDEARLSENADNLREVARQLLKDSFKSERPWSTVEFWCEGSKTREHLYTDRGLSRSRVYDGTVDVALDKYNRQVTLNRPGGSNSYRRTLDAFRYVPRELPAGVKVARREGENVVLEGPGLQLTASQSTGLGRLVTSTGDGAATREVQQLGPVSYASGITFPTAFVDAQYSGEALRYLTVIVIEKAQLNEPLDSATFTLPAGPGTAVFDRRVEAARPRYVAVKKPVSNVVEYVNSRTDIARPPTPAQDNVTRPRNVMIVIVAALTALAVIIAGGLLLRKQRASGGIRTHQE